MPRVTRTPARDNKCFSSCYLRTPALNIFRLPKRTLSPWASGTQPTPSWRAGSTRSNKSTRPPLTRQKCLRGHCPAHFAPALCSVMQCGAVVHCAHPQFQTGKWAAKPTLTVSGVQNHKISICHSFYPNKLPIMLQL